MPEAVALMGLMKYVCPVAVRDVCSEVDGSYWQKLLCNGWRWTWRGGWLSVVVNEGNINGVVWMV